MDNKQWINLMERLGYEDNLDTFSRLQAHYSQKHRYYHNSNHIDATLKHLWQAKELAIDVNAVEVALWFHDAIYKIFSASNELDSANWASDFLQKNGACTELIDKVHRLIMATLHTATPEDNDEKLIVDIDLSILGAHPDLYSQFEEWVRKEYKLIPRFIYRKERKKVLKSFLDKDRIYSHDYFFNLFEKNARANLINAISNL